MGNFPSDVIEMSYTFMPALFDLENNIPTTIILHYSSLIFKTKFDVMKKILLFVFLISCFTNVFSAAHKKFIVKVSNFQFSPATVSAHVGDTIMWVWVNGGHTTTSLTHPVGSGTWNKPINSTNKQFKFVVKVAGKYTYRCNIHPTVMKGTINVTTALTAALQSFDVSDAEAKSLLNWRTLSSQDVAYFSVQRSTDGDNFKKLQGYILISQTSTNSQIITIHLQNIFITRLKWLIQKEIMSCQKSRCLHKILHRLNLLQALAPILLVILHM